MSDLPISANTNEMEIAIIGMSGRFPGANPIETFWENLCNGIESISLFNKKQLQEAGIDPKLINDSFYAEEKRHRIPLPTYPFERESYWIAPQKGMISDMSKTTALGKKSDITEWFYIPSWKRSAPPLSDHGGDSVSESDKRMLGTIGRRLRYEHL